MLGSNETPTQGETPLPTYADPTLLAELAEARPEGGVVSLYLDTDPRKPENASDNPAWLVQLRNGLRAVGEQIDEQGDRDTVLAWREASGRIEDRVKELSAADRGRALALFTTLDGSWEQVVTSHLTLEQTHAAWDDRPWVAPLAKLVDRGRAIGIVLLDSDEMSVLRWADGRISESGLETDLDTFRSENITGGEGGHDPRLRTHTDQLSSRADEHQRRFLADAGPGSPDRCRTSASSRSWSSMHRGRWPTSRRPCPRTLPTAWWAPSRPTSRGWTRTRWPTDSR